MNPLLHRPYALWLAFALCACVLLLAPDLVHATASAKLQAMTVKLNDTLSLIGKSLRNVLYGVAALTVVICGGAAFMGRFPARWLWTVGGGVVTMALGGLAVDVLIADAAISGNAQVYAVELQ